MSLSARFRVVALAITASFVFAPVAPSHAEGWKFWEGKETTVDDGVGGTPYASSTRKGSAPRQSGYVFPESSGGSSWNVGAGMTNAGKSVVNGTIGAMKKTASVTKSVTKKTVDVVTLKPLWGPKPQPNQFALGAHPDPRSKNANKPSLWGASSKTKGTPSTPSQFFSQPRVR